VVPDSPLETWFDDEGVNPLVVERNTEYVTPLVDDAFQLRLIELDEAAVAMRPVGADGALAVQLVLPGKTSNSDICAAVQPVFAVKDSSRYCSLVPAGRLKLTVFEGVVEGLKV
jgi:hypothetical protein